MSSLQLFEPSTDAPEIVAICNYDWAGLAERDVISAAWAYYYFSIQFRENLEIAVSVFPEDENLERLKVEECNTSNLSPYPEIAVIGEKMDHDEFMRRALKLSPISDETIRGYDAAGQDYLAEVRAMSLEARALSISSYEAGGLERLFKAILQSPAYDNKLIAAFRFFMLEHIRFDSDPIQGHGALSRNLTGDADIRPLWNAFDRLLLAFAPALKVSMPAQTAAYATVAA